MIDHVILTVADFMRSIRFYERALRPLGITDFLDFPGENGHPHLKGFGANGRYFFWLKEGEPRPDAVHVGFAAQSQAKVRDPASARTSAAALALSGRMSASTTCLPTPTRRAIAWPI